MILNAIHHIRTAIILFVIMLFITGFCYPYFVTVLAQTFFPWRANGSLLYQENHLIGSELIGQDFSDNQYFWGRLSATLPFPYTGDASSASNWSMNHPDLMTAADNRLIALLSTNFSGNPSHIPVDLLTASGSGLDPEISVDAALYQVGRVAGERHIDPVILTSLIHRLSIKPWAGIFGEPRVNVLQLNISIETLGKNTEEPL